MALMQDKTFIEYALKVHKDIFCLIQKNLDRKSEEFKILKKGLGYTFSLIVLANPKEDFKYLEYLIETNDPDILWIIKSNLSKNRLIKNFPKNVKKLKKLIK